MSRMDRYYKQDSDSSKRSAKNQDLYKNIYNLGEYSNIEGIATIDNSNEIDITKVKNMLRNREEYQRQREIIQITPKEELIPNYEVFEQEEDRVYDIRDILKKAKVSRPTEEKHRSLSNTNYDILKDLKSKKNSADENLKGLIDTISETSQLNKLSDHQLGLDMFDTLKSSENTIIDSNNSIKNLLEEARKNDQKKLVNTNTNLDKSFFTSSLNFSEDDFEQIVELSKNVKKNNLLIKILVFIIILLIAAGVIFLVFNLIK